MGLSHTNNKESFTALHAALRTLSSLFRLFGTQLEFEQIESSESVFLMVITAFLSAFRLVRTDCATIHFL